MEHSRQKMLYKYFDVYDVTNVVCFGAQKAYNNNRQILQDGTNTIAKKIMKSNYHFFPSFFNFHYGKHKVHETPQITA